MTSKFKSARIARARLGGRNTHKLPQPFISRLEGAWLAAAILLAYALAAWADAGGGIL
jgi:hypothetical protein